MANPFSRITALFALAAAAMQSTPGLGMAQAISMGGGYTSRGKGEGKSNRFAPGANGAFKRAAAKARNVTKARKASRG